VVEKSIIRANRVVAWSFISSPTFRYVSLFTARFLALHPENGFIGNF